MSRPDWVMTVPVISTAHMPRPDSLEKFSDSVVAVYEDGGFLYLPTNPPKDTWTIPIDAWLTANFGEDQSWVRFDCDADVIEGLPVYNWSEK